MCMHAYVHTYVYAWYVHTYDTYINNIQPLEIATINKCITWAVLVGRLVAATFAGSSNLCAWERAHLCVCVCGVCVCECVSECLCLLGVGMCVWERERWRESARERECARARARESIPCFALEFHHARKESARTSAQLLKILPALNRVRPVRGMDNIAQSERERARELSFGIQRTHLYEKRPDSVFLCEHLRRERYEDAQVSIFVLVAYHW
jgi:hypothetical protein